MTDEEVLGILVSRAREARLLANVNDNAGNGAMAQYQDGVEHGLRVAIQLLSEEQS